MKISKSVRKSRRRSVRKSRRRSVKKSARKSRRRSAKKSARKSRRRSARKSFGFARDTDKWEVYTLNGCGYCKLAIELLEKNGQKFKTENGINNPKVPELMKKSGAENHKYWPKIFLNGKYFGGYTDLEKRFPQNK